LIGRACPKQEITGSYGNHYHYHGTNLASRKDTTSRSRGRLFHRLAEKTLAIEPIPGKTIEGGAGSPAHNVYHGLKQVLHMRLL